MIGTVEVMGQTATLDDEGNWHHPVPVLEKYLQSFFAPSSSPAAGTFGVEALHLVAEQFDSQPDIKATIVGEDVQP